MMEKATFKVQAQADPQTLLRLLEYLVQLDLLPSLVFAFEAAGSMTVVIEQEGLGKQQADTIARRMRSLLRVETVALTHSARSHSISDFVDTARRAR